MENNTESALQALEKELPQLRKIMIANVGAGADVEVLVRSEIDYLLQHALTKPDILKAEPITVAHAIKNVLRKNLSLDPSLGLVYCKTRNMNLGTSAAPKWAIALEIQESVDGLISFARQCERILDIMRPEIRQNAEGRVISVTVKMLVPSYNDIGKPTPRWEETTFDEQDFKRWKLASHNERGRGKQDANATTLNYANRLYSNENGGIDREFARAKAIRHALKKKGTNPNERRKPAFKTIQIPHATIVDKGADLEAANDDGKFTEYDEVLTNNGPTDAPKAPAAGNGSSVDLPDASAL